MEMVQGPEFIQSISAFKHERFKGRYKDSHGNCRYADLIIECVSPAWRHHQMGTFSALLALCADISPVTGEFPSQRPVTRIFDVFFDLRLNKRLSRQSWGWGFETPLRLSWRHCYGEMCCVDQEWVSMKHWYVICIWCICNIAQIAMFILL